MKIHEKIRLVRNYNGFTQEYVAECLNIDPVNYGRIERGQAKITVERLEQIAEIFGISLMELYYFDTEKMDKVQITNQEDVDAIKILSRQDIMEILNYNKQLLTKIFLELRKLREQQAKK